MQKAFLEDQQTPGRQKQAYDDGLCGNPYQNSAAILRQSAFHGRQNTIDDHLADPGRQNRSNGHHDRGTGNGQRQAWSGAPDQSKGPCDISGALHRAGCWSLI